MRIAIIQFPGSNCERETMLAVKRAGMLPVEFLWNEPREKLASFDGFIIIGGFSYEDRSRAGIIAALDPVMQVIKEQSELGKPILGICNGAQILLESGLVPGIKNNTPCMVLTDNKRMQKGTILGTGFYNAWVHMRLTDKYQHNAFTRYLTPKKILHLPVAHGEGRFVIPPKLLVEINEKGLNTFQYCNENGNIIEEFPINPNGSINNIAAISNYAGNVLAIMPHPERTQSCDDIFVSMRDYINDHAKQKNKPLEYFPEPYKIKKYKPKGKELIVSLLIADNQSLSVESSLQHNNISVKIKRYSHWEVVCDSSSTIEKITSSGLLYNDRKEKLLQTFPNNNSTFLVRHKDDINGLQKLQMLKNNFGIDDVNAIFYSTLWHVNGDDNAINEVINSNILFNSNAHDCYNY